MMAVQIGSVMAGEEMQIGLIKKVFAILKLYFRVFMKWTAKNRVYNIYSNFFLLVRSWNIITRR